MGTLHEAAHRVVAAWAGLRPTRPSWIEDVNAAVLSLGEALKAEPAQEPVAGVVLNEEGRAALVEHGREEWHCVARRARRLYTAPQPQRPPLTDEEILEAVGWERAEMYMKLTPNFQVDEAKKETLKNARAIERKVRGEKE